MSKLFSISACTIIVLLIMSIMLSYLSNGHNNILVDTVSELDSDGDKLLELSAPNSGFIERLVVYMVKPFFEKRIDYYLRNSGLIDNFSKIPYDNKLLSITNLAIGSGSIAQCGQMVKIKVRKIVDKAEEDDVSTEFKDIEVVLGADSLDRVLLLGLIGMKVGEVRIIKENHDSKDSYYVEMLSFMDKGADLSSIRTFDKLGTYQKAVMCGDKVKIDFTINDIQGNELCRNSGLKFKVGASEVPMGIDHGIIEMHNKGSRTIIVPHKFMIVADSMQRIFMDCMANNDETVIVNINNLEIIKK